MLNDDQIVLLEPLHDTLIVLANGDRLRVQETPDQIAERVAHWRRRVMGLALISADELPELAEPGEPNESSRRELPGLPSEADER